MVFILSQNASDNEKHLKGDFAIYTNTDATKVNYCWFRGGWWDPLTMAWNAIADGKIVENAPVKEEAPGASLYVPFKVKAGETYSVRLQMAWYVPDSNMRIGADAVSEDDKSSECPIVEKVETPQYYRPWYVVVSADINEVQNIGYRNMMSLNRKLNYLQILFIILLYRQRLLML